MGLLGSTTQFQYYNQQQKWLGSEGAANGSVPRAIFTFPTDFTHVPSTEDDFIVKLNGEEQPRENYVYNNVNPETITFTHKTVNNVRTALSNSTIPEDADTVVLLAIEAGLLVEGVVTTPLLSIVSAEVPAVFCIASTFNTELIGLPPINA